MSEPMTDDELAAAVTAVNDFDPWHFGRPVVAKLVAEVQRLREGERVAEVERLTDALDDVLCNLRYAVDPYKAPEMVDQFIRQALAIAERATGEQQSSETPA